MSQRYPQPVTAAMLALANPNAPLPRYSGAGVAGDWLGGAVGNDVNAATANVAAARSGSSSVEPDYVPRTQLDRGNLMAPALTVLADLGKDYGAYAGLAGRDGAIGPRDPYPAVST